MKNFVAILVLILFWSMQKKFEETEKTQWNPDAGLVFPLSENATITTSSNSKDAQKILDGNTETAWQSEAPLPEGFLKRQDLNIFLKKNLKITGSDEIKNSQDGNLSSVTTISKNGESCELIFDFAKTQNFQSIALKCGIAQELEVFGENSNGAKSKLFTYSKKDNYRFKRFEIGAKYQKIILSSSESFQLFEIAALEKFPTEYAILDFGTLRNVGVIHTKHWAGEQNVKSTKLWLSKDQESWQFIGSLNTENVHNYMTNVQPEMQARYLKIEHELIPKDWNKVFLWEIKVYDKYGHYGAKPTAQQSNVSLGEMLGVNSYWSWGTNEYSDQLDENAGPKLYAPLASHARNYHDLTWDLTHPDESIDFQKMADGGGTPAKSWLNWDREYKAWGKESLNVQASIQFFRFEQASWKNPFQSAFNYGKNYAEHFGISKGNGYICSMEVGNEPWKYDAPIYSQILLGMAQGAKAGDPKMEVFPCALQAADPDMEKTGIFKNYIGVRIPEEVKDYLDGINIHAYSYVNNFWGNRIGIFPEHPNSSFWEILNAIRWCDENMPGKKIYLSEWGWDCGGGGEDCTHSECVSEKAGAAYAIRGALIALRLGLDRATWYFYGNTENQSSLYTRSGLTGSPHTNFQKKKVFRALQFLVKIVGEKYFLETILEDNSAWIYLLGNPDGTPTHLIGWRPIDADVDSPIIIKWKTKLKSKNAWLLDGDKENGTPVSLPSIENGEMILKLNAVPLVVELKATQQ